MRSSDNARGSSADGFIAGGAQPAQPPDQPSQRRHSQLLRYHSAALSVQAARIGPQTMAERNTISPTPMGQSASSARTATSSPGALTPADHARRPTGHSPAEEDDSHRKPRGARPPRSPTARRRLTTLRLAQERPRQDPAPGRSGTPSANGLCARGAPESSERRRRTLAGFGMVVAELPAGMTPRPTIRHRPKRLLRHS